MALHHYLPATYLALFSSNKTTLPMRKRPLFVGDKRTGRIREAPAANLGAINNLYTLINDSTHPEQVDQTWSDYEQRLPQAIQNLIADHVDAETWLRILVPFVACMLVRGPDFDLRFTRRLRALGLGPTGTPVTPDNTNGARLFELQRLLGPVAAAKWIVVSIQGGPLLTSDLAYTPFVHPRSGDSGMAIPLGQSHVLAIVPQQGRTVLMARGNKWIPVIHRVRAAAHEQTGLNKAIAANAQRFLFGPNAETISAFLLAGHTPGLPPEPEQLGFISGPLAVAHEFTWHRLVSAIAKPPSDLKQWDFALDWKTVAAGWHPPVFFAMNLLEFPPALHRKGPRISVRFYDPQLYFALSEIRQYESMEDPAGAAATATKALAMPGADKHKVSLLISRGTALLELKKPRDALSDFERVLSLEPDNPVPLVNQAYAQMELALKEDALASLNKAVELDPHLPEARLNRGALLAILGQAGAAIEDLSLAIESLPDGPARASALLNRGIAFGMEHSYENAAVDLTNATSMYPDRREKANCLLQRAIIHHSTGSDQEAIADLTQAIEFNPELLLAYSARAQIHSDLGHHDLSLSDIELALQQNPDEDTRANLLRARAIERSQLGQEESARADFRQAIELAPGKPLPLEDFGLFLLMQGELTQAIEALSSSLSIDPQRPKAHNNLGVCRALQRDHELAISAFDEALASNPEDADRASAYRNKAMSLAALGRVKEADEALALASALAPDAPLTLMAAAQLQLFHGNPSESLRLHLAAEEAFHDDDGPNPFKALALLSLHNPESALEVLRVWAGQSPSPVERIRLRNELEALGLREPNLPGMDAAIETLHLAHDANQHTSQ
jgi:tetratricopeptide (TPR) repeat protein